MNSFYMFMHNTTHLTITMCKKKKTKKPPGKSVPKILLTVFELFALYFVFYIFT